MVFSLFVNYLRLCFVILVRLRHRRCRSKKGMGLTQGLEIGKINYSLLKNLPGLVGNAQSATCGKVLITSSVTISYLFIQMFFPIVGLLFMRSAFRGAQNITFGALKESENLVNGGFYR